MEEANRTRLMSDLHKSKGRFVPLAVAGGSRYGRYSGAKSRLGPCVSLSQRPFSNFIAYE